ncbi:MAG TPA: hypothetical protein VN711_01175 [Candidatus Saccharimonadales bacterium]|nr:hypothetical protein [Candidatus Saccharimonadales bacterium]
MEEKHPEEHTKQHNPYQLRTILSWEAPGRPYKTHTKQYYATILLIALLVEIILFLFSQYALMIVVASLVFLSFALAMTPPQNFHYRISTEGIMVEDHFFLWKELYDFYFKTANGIPTLHIRTEAFFPGEIIIALGDMSEKHLEQALLPYLPYREYVKPTFMEKGADWLTANFPLEHKAEK